MTDHRCPTEPELLAFADAQLSPEQLQRVEQHLKRCSACAKRVRGFSELIPDIAAPVGHPPLDVAKHVAGVMERLDRPGTAQRGSRLPVWGGALGAVLAAAAAWAVFTRSPPLDQPQGHFAARGSSAEASLRRDVGVQLYAQEASLRRLVSGSAIQSGTPLTAGLRNLAAGRAYLLLFGIDARGSVHWIAPQFTALGSDPEALSLATSSSERLLPSSVAFDDLAPGPLRVVTLLTTRPTHVSEIERLTAAELRGSGLAARFPQADIRQVVLEVAP